MIEGLLRQLEHSEALLGRALAGAGPAQGALQRIKAGATHDRLIDDVELLRSWLNDLAALAEAANDYHHPELKSLGAFLLEQAETIDYALLQ